MAALAAATLAALALAGVATPSAEAVGGTTFRNPLLANGADPWLQYFEGNYYLATTTWTSQLVMRKSPTLAGLATAPPVYVWSETAADSCCNFWAFEFHRLNGPSGTRWYLMFTLGHSANLDRQHLTVLESAGDDPMGPYIYRGSPMPSTWNIDGSYITIGGQLYQLSSEWQGADQSVWIARMTTANVQGGAYTLVNRNSGLCLTATGTADGANVAQGDCAAAASRWVLDQTADGYHRLVNRSTRKALDLADCSSADGADIRQWAWLDNTCQQFQPVTTADGWLRLQNRASGKVFDVADCSTDGDANVRAWVYNGSVRLLARHSGKAVDLANCGLAMGANIAQWSWLDNICQRFHLRAV